MKILYHHRTQSNGVEGVHIQGVIKTLREQQHDVHVVSLVKDNETENIQAPTSNTSSFLQKFLRSFAQNAPNSVFRLAEFFYNILAFFKIRKVLSSHNIDIIYERYAYFNFSGVLAAKLYKKPLILEVNIYTGLNDARQLALRPLAEFIEKRVFQASDSIFVISDYLKDSMVERYQLDAKKIHVHPNAVDPLQLEQSNICSSPIISQITANSVSIVFLGRLLPWYKLHELITTFKSIVQKHPSTQLVLIGDGSERTNLEKQLKQYGIIDQVVFCGSVNHDEALAILANCDIGVIPSTNMWGSPMKLFEYMGSSLPVVAPNIGVINAIMTNNVHGKLFEYDNFMEFEASLNTLVENEKQRKTMGIDAKQHILENHSWEKVSQHVIKVAENLIN